MTETAWMKELEVQVEKAADEVRRLRDENKGLRGELEETRRTLDTAGAGDASDWVEERAAVRERVEQLVARLETLLRS